MPGDQPAKLPLSQAKRASLFAGNCPGIAGQGDCPVEPGDVVELSKRVTLRILRVDAHRGGWKLHYELHDRRDPVRMIRRTPPVVVPDPGDEAPTPGAIRRAAEESSYTGSPIGAISDAGEAVDEKTQERFTKDARERFSADLEAERERRKNLPVSEQLAAVLEDAKRTGRDVSGDLRVIQRRIEAMKRKTDAA